MNGHKVVLEGKNAYLSVNERIVLEGGRSNLSIEQNELLGACKTSENSIDVLGFIADKFQRISLLTDNPDTLVSQIQHLAFPGLSKNVEKKHFLVFLNPTSGRGLALQRWKAVSGMFDGCWVTLHQTQYRGHAHDIVKDADLSEIDGLISVSGDGLVHEIINGLCKNPKFVKTPIGVIPAGSGNALAQYLLNSSPLNIQKCASICIKGNRSPLDINEISFADGSVIYSFLSISWGYIAEVDIESDYFRCCGIIRYYLYGVWKFIRLRRYFGEFKSDEFEYNGPFSYFYVCNLPFVGENMKVAPLAQASDGVCDFLIMGNVSRVKLLKVLLKQDSGQHLSCEGLEYFQSKGFSLSPNGGYFAIDGDFYPAQRISVRVLDSQINIFTA